jgi:hypothetical protein
MLLNLKMGSLVRDMSHLAWAIAMTNAEDGHQYGRARM